MKIQINNELPKINSQLSTERYEIVANETISNCNQTNVLISGSLLSMVEFNNVNFDGLALFGSKIEQCDFTNCSFVNCKFQFSHLNDTSFVGCTFENCSWETTNIADSAFENCIMDVKTTYFASKNENVITGCFGKQKLEVAILEQDREMLEMPIAA